MKLHHGSQRSTGIDLVSSTFLRFDLKSSFSSHHCHCRLVFVVCGVFGLDRLADCRVTATSSNLPLIFFLLLLLTFLTFFVAPLPPSYSSLRINWNRILLLSLPFVCSTSTYGVTTHTHTQTQRTHGTHTHSIARAHPLTFFHSTFTSFLFFIIYVFNQDSSRRQRKRTYFNSFGFVQRFMLSKDRPSSSPRRRNENIGHAARIHCAPIRYNDNGIIDVKSTET